MVVPLPEIENPNGDDVQIKVDNQIIGFPPVEFLEWVPTTKELVFTIDEQVQPNFYEFMITLSDRQESSRYTILLHIKENKLPYIEETLTFPTYKIGSGINNYTLPEIIDEDGDTVSIEV